MENVLYDNVREATIATYHYLSLYVLKDDNDSICTTLQSLQNDFIILSHFIVSITLYDR